MTYVRNFSFVTANPSLEHVRLICLNPLSMLIGPAFKWLGDNLLQLSRNRSVGLANSYGLMLETSKCLRGGE